MTSEVFIIPLRQGNAGGKTEMKKKNQSFNKFKHNGSN